MKVLGINCSPRKGGNTELLIYEVFNALEAEGIKTEFFQLGGKDVNGCIACMKCRKEKDGICHQKNEVIKKPADFSRLSLLMSEHSRSVLVTLAFYIMCM